MKLLKKQRLTRLKDKTRNKKNMKWFKHISDSMQDPLIVHLVNEFGPLGYMVFFGVLEKYAREFKIDPGWRLRVKLEFFRGSFQQKQKKNIKNILNFLQSSEKWLIKFSGNPSSDKEEVEIQIPKFAQFLDETTKKKMRLNSGIDPEKIRIYPHTEEEEEEEDNIINTPPIAPPLGDGENQKKIEISEPEDKAKPEVKKPSVPVEEIVALYHEVLPELPRANKIKPERRKTITARWNEDKGRQSLEWWREYFESVRSQDFLIGENNRGFRANIDFLVTKSKMTKVEEGQYGNSGGKSSLSRQDKAFRDAFSNLMAFGGQNESDGIFEANGKVISNLRSDEVRRGPGSCQSTGIRQGPKLFPAPGPGNSCGYDFGKLEANDVGKIPLSGNAPGIDASGHAESGRPGASRGAENGPRKARTDGS